MVRIQLIVYQAPSQVDVICNFRRQDGTFEPTTAIIDTGAEISLLPAIWLDFLDYRPVGKGTIEIHQAGIAKQSFKATEAVVYVYLEDLVGKRTDLYEIVVWFAASDQVLLGFGGLLEKAILHLDMPNLTGYLEL